jgi:hypothetical protein
VGPVDKRFRQIESAAFTKVLGERTEDLHEDAIAHPLLHPSMARLIRRIFTRQRSPRRARPQHPQNAFEHGPGLDARPAATVATTTPLWHQRRDDLPLLIRQLHVDV